MEHRPVNPTPRICRSRAVCGYFSLQSVHLAVVTRIGQVSNLIDDRIQRTLALPGQLSLARRTASRESKSEGLDLRPAEV